MWPSSRVNYWCRCPVTCTIDWANCRPPLCCPPPYHVTSTAALSVCHTHFFFPFSFFTTSICHRALRLLKSKRRYLVSAFTVSWKDINYRLVAAWALARLLTLLCVRVCARVMDVTESPVLFLLLIIWRKKNGNWSRREKWPLLFNLSQCSCETCLCLRLCCFYTHTHTHKCCTFWLIEHTVCSPQERKRTLATAPAIIPSTQAG